MDTLRMPVSYNEHTNTMYYTTFEIVDRLPKINDDNYGYIVTKVEQVMLDFSAARIEGAYDYAYFKVTEVDPEAPSEETYRYVAADRTYHLLSYKIYPANCKLFLENDLDGCDDNVASFRIELDGLYYEDYIDEDEDEDIDLEEKRREIIEEFTNDKMDEICEKCLIKNSNYDEIYKAVQEAYETKFH